MRSLVCSKEFTLTVAGAPTPDLWWNYQTASASMPDQGGWR